MLRNFFKCSLIVNESWGKTFGFSLKCRRWSENCSHFSTCFFVGVPFLLALKLWTCFLSTHTDGLNLNFKKMPPPPTPSFWPIMCELEIMFFTPFPFTPTFITHSLITVMFFVYLFASVWKIPINFNFATQKKMKKNELEKNCPGTNIHYIIGVCLEGWILKNGHIFTHLPKIWL